MSPPEIKPPKTTKFFTWSFVIFFVFIPAIFGVPLVLMLDSVLIGTSSLNTVEDGFFWVLTFLVTGVLATYTFLGWIIRLIRYRA